MDKPPSAIGVAPVTNDASSLASQRIGYAISSGPPPNGFRTLGSGCFRAVYPAVDQFEKGFLCSRYHFSSGLRITSSTFGRLK